MTQITRSDAYLPKLAELWKATLDVPAAQPDDNFFSLGGNSLVLVHLITNIQSEFGISLEPEVLFENPTLGSMAEQIAHRATMAEQQAGPAPLGRVAKRVSSNQERHWVFRNKKARLYNMYYEARITGLAQPERLPLHFAATLNNNRILKFIFERRDDGVYAIPRADVPAVQLADLTNVSPQDVPDRLREIRHRLVTSDFDIWNEPAFAATYAITGPDEGCMMFCANHILLDLESLEILFAELYARCCGLPIREKGLDFYDVAMWERGREDTISPQELTDYWRQKLAPCTSALKFAGRERPDAFVGTASTERIAITDESALRFLRSADSTLPPLFTKVMSAVALAVFAQYAEAPLAISYPVAVRPHPDAADVVGNFLCHNFFVLDPRTGTDLATWLAGNNRQFVADILHRQLNLLDKEALLPARIKDFYGKCQIRCQFYDMTFGAPPASSPLRITRPEAHFDKALADLHFFVELRESGLHIMAVYYNALFSPEEVQALLRKLTFTIERLEALKTQTLSRVVAEIASANRIASSDRPPPSHPDRGGGQAHTADSGDSRIRAP